MRGLFDRRFHFDFNQVHAHSIHGGNAEAVIDKTAAPIYTRMHADRDMWKPFWPGIILMLSFCNSNRNSSIIYLSNIVSFKGNVCSISVDADEMNEKWVLSLGQQWKVEISEIEEKQSSSLWKSYVLQVFFYRNIVILTVYGKAKKIHMP